MPRSASARPPSGRLASPPPVALNQISNQITNDTGVPLGLKHAYTKLSDDTLMRLGGVSRILPECRPITTFEGEYIHAGTGESVTSRGCMRSQRDYSNVDERAVIDSFDETEQTKGKAAGLRIGYGPSSKSGTAQTEETAEKGPGSKSWAMISREYPGILVLFCTASGVLYIHKIDFQRKTLRLQHPSPFSSFFVPFTPHLRSFPKLLFPESLLSVSSSYTVILILRKPSLFSYIRPSPNYHSVTLVRSNSQ